MDTHRTRARRLRIRPRAAGLVILGLVATCVLDVSGAHAAIVATELLGRPTDNSMTVNVVADVDLEAWFEWGTSSGAYVGQTAPGTFAAGTPIEQVMGGLLPDTLYHYRMRYRAPGTVAWLARPEHTFRTQRARGSTFVFDVQSDSHIYDKKGNHALYAIALQNEGADAADFLVDIGDTFGDDHDLTIGYPAVLQLHFDQRPFLGIVGGDAPVFLALGNHEGEAGWILSAGAPNNVAVCGTLARQLYFPNPVPDGFYTGSEVPEPWVGLAENYYAFEWGDALFVVLDPYRYELVDRKVSGDLWDWTIGKTQYDWLAQTLRSSSAKYKFVFGHHVMGETRGGAIWADKYEWGGKNNNGTWGFGTRRPGWATPIHQLLVETGVQVFFQGHDHLYAKETLDGVVYQEVPMPSDATYNVGAVNAGAYVGTVLGNSGHLRVTVSPSQARVEYVRAFLPGDGTNGSVSDSYEVLPAGSSSPTPVPTATPTPAPATPTPTPSPVPTSTPDGIVFVAGELLGRPTGSSVTVQMQANQRVEAVVDYGTSAGAYAAATSPVTAEAGEPLVLVLSGLSADTAYRYRVRYRTPGAGAWSTREEHGFRTQRPRGATFTFDVQADPHLDSNTNPELYRRTLSNVLADAPDFLVDLGDTFMSEKFATNMDEAIARHLLARDYYDDVGASVPLFLAMGNHEGEEGWLLDGTANVLPVWASNARTSLYPNPVPDGFYTGNPDSEPFVGRRQNYYAFEWGDALVVVLDPYWYTTSKPSRTGDDWDWTLGRSQYDWLKQTLEGSTARFKFVFSHQLVGGFDGIGRGGVEAAPYYEWGGRNADGTEGFALHRPGWGVPIHQLLVDNGVSVFFHGHDHLFAKQEKDGVIYQEVPQPGDPRGSTASGLSYGYTTGELLGSSGHLRITVSPASAIVEYVKSFRPVDEDATHVNRSVATSYALVRDGDDDGLPDGQDPCTTLEASAAPSSPPDQTTSKVKVALTNLALADGSQGVSAEGYFNPAATGASPDPAADGVRLRIADAGGAIYDVDVPGGLVGASSCGPRDGWRKTVTSTTTTWRWSAPSGGLPDGAGGCLAGAARGLASVYVKDATRTRTAAWQWKAVARRAVLSASPTEPRTELAVDFSLGARSGVDASAASMNGQCTEYVFTGTPIDSASPPPYCRPTPSTGAPRTIRCVGP